MLRVQITHAADDDGDTADVDFDALKASPEVKAMINQLRVCSCLIAYVLIFIKEMPHCRPNLAFASLLTNKWDSILWCAATHRQTARPSAYRASRVAAGTSTTCRGRRSGSGSSGG